jgi:hypothetical protein
MHISISCFYDSDMENIPVLIMIWKSNLLDMTTVQILHTMQQLMAIEAP